MALWKMFRSTPKIMNLMCVEFMQRINLAVEDNKVTKSEEKTVRVRPLTHHHHYKW